MAQTLILVLTAATLFSSGVLWTLQVLNYPLLALVGREALPAYEAQHSRRFGIVVIPGVVLSIGASVGLLIVRTPTVPLWFPVLQVVLMAVIVISTAAVQARQHGRLAAGWEDSAHRLLVRSNWLRVAAWSAAGLLALWMCQRTFGS